MKLGFNARIAFRTGHEEQGLRDGIELFRAAEQLGYDTGWVYQRHFDNYLSAPLPFLAAVGQHTSRIRLGTAIIGVRYESPVQLAEAAAVTDLLTGGRLELGLGTGQGGYDAQFGQPPNDGREQSQQRLAGLLDGLRGSSLGTVEDPSGLVRSGETLTVRPHAAGLAERVWYGAGSAESATRVGSQGLRLLLSTILSGRVEDYGAELARAIDAYRRAHTDRTASRVAVARSVLPATTTELAALYRAYDEERRAHGPAASRPDGSLRPQSTAPALFTMSPVHHGDPGDVVEQLLADPSVAKSDELIAFLPPAFGLRDNLRLLEDIATTVAPHLEHHDALEGSR